MRSIIILFILVMLTSCAKNPTEKYVEAIDIAQSLLSDQKCDEAIKILTEVGYDDDNAIYLQVLASAYACKASFDEINFVSTDLAGIVTTSFATILKSLSIMSLSDETEADSDEYTSVLTGINFLLGSTSGVPSQVDRATKFGTRKSGDMGVQALILNVVNLGKFLNYYGNVNAAGAKSLGSATNSCFINYTYASARAVITGGAGGVCNTFIDGHADLDLTTDDGKRRACEGLMSLTNVIDILDNLDLSGNSSMSSLEDISAEVNTFKAIAVAAGLGTLINMTSQSECEDNLNTSTDDMQYLFSLTFETGLQ